MPHAIRVPLLLVLVPLAALLTAAEERQQPHSANGTALPLGLRVATYRVWCYDAGAVSLRGQKGVLDVVRAIRRKPFAEWNTVYYDPRKADPDSLLEALRSAHCPKATREEAVTKRQGELIARCDTPLVVRGDCIALALRNPGEATIAWTLPEGWSLVQGPTGEAEAGDHPILIQTPAEAAAGEHEVGLRIAPADDEAVDWQWSVELVDLVAPRR